MSPGSGRAWKVRGPGCRAGPNGKCARSTFQQLEDHLRAHLPAHLREQLGPVWAFTFLLWAETASTCTTAAKKVMLESCRPTAKSSAQWFKNDADNLQAGSRPGRARIRAPRALGGRPCAGSAQVPLGTWISGVPAPKGLKARLILLIPVNEVSRESPQKNGIQPNLR